MWKAEVRERMKDLEVWERSKGHLWQGAPVERNKAREKEVIFECNVCRKRCKSKGGLVIHTRRMHEVPKRKKVFECEGCGQKFQHEANLWNHRKVCGGEEASGSERRKCARGREFAKSYIARHRKKCTSAQAVEEEVSRMPRVYKSAKTTCDCGKEMAKTNLARHKREACPMR